MMVATARPSHSGGPPVQAMGPRIAARSAPREWRRARLRRAASARRSASGKIHRGGRHARRCRGPRMTTRRSQAASTRRNAPARLPATAPARMYQGPETVCCTITATTAPDDEGQDIAQLLEEGDRHAGEKRREHEVDAEDRRGCQEFVRRHGRPRCRRPRRKNTMATLLPIRKAPSSRPSRIFAQKRHRPVGVAHEQQRRIGLARRQPAEPRATRPRRAADTARSWRESRGRQPRPGIGLPHACSVAICAPPAYTQALISAISDTDRPFEAASRPTPSPKAISVGAIRMPLWAPSRTPCHVKVGAFVTAPRSPPS